MFCWPKLADKQNPSDEINSIPSDEILCFLKSAPRQNPLCKRQYILEDVAVIEENMKHIYELFKVLLSLNIDFVLSNFVVTTWDSPVRVI